MGYVLLHNPYTIFDMYDLLTIASIICLAVSTRFTNKKYIYITLPKNNESLGYCLLHALFWKDERIKHMVWFGEIQNYKIKY